MADFIEQVENDEWEVETPNGWQSFSGVGKTVQYDVWEVVTDATTLRCADDHLLYRFGETTPTHAKDLKPGDRLEAKDCPQTVVSVTKTESTEHMYDLMDVESGNTYYSNGLLSHNSTTVLAYFLHYLLFNPDVKVAILANKANTAKDLLDKWKIAYENLPRWMQHGVVEWNKHNVTLENGSKIVASATSSSAIRGSSLNAVLLDEFAFVPQNIAENFFRSVYPVITSGTQTKMVIMSTPNGINHFHKIWMNAINKKNDYVPVEARWFDVPGRDEAFKKSTIANTSEAQWRVEYECVHPDTMISIFDKKTKAYMDMRIRDFYDFGCDKET